MTARAGRARPSPGAIKGNHAAQFDREGPGTRSYRVFGASVVSPIPLAAEAASREMKAVAADIVIRFGNVPELAGVEPDFGAGVLCRKSEHGFLFGFDDAVRFAVCDGREVIVDQAPRVDRDFVRLLLQGSPFGALLHQRGLLVLHGCTVVIEGRAIAVVGESGVGKSTLAMALLKRGHTLLGDDFAAIRVDKAGAVALPGFREAKLWGDSAERLSNGFSENDPKPLWPGIRKYSMPLPPPVPDEAPLAAVVVLEVGTESHIEVDAIQGAQRLAMVVNHIYRRNFLNALGRAQQSHALAACVASAVSMWRVKRPRRPLAMIDKLVEQIERLAET